MAFLAAFGRFWWDFVIGDDWRIAAGVVLVLAAGALLVSGTDLSDGATATLVAAGILGVAIGSIVHGAAGLVDPLVRPSRPLPYVGMPVEVCYLAVREPAVVEEVADDGRTLIVAGEAYTLNAVNGEYVRAGEPYYGTRLRLEPG